ncbi:hypothetical protein CPC08DRAFT_708622, partial [Agrocybe pediades]
SPFSTNPQPKTASRRPSKCCEQTKVGTNRPLQGNDHKHKAYHQVFAKERRRTPWLSFWTIRLLAMSKSVLGWREKIDMHDLICRGKFGLDGLFSYGKHFIVKRRKVLTFQSLIPANPRRRK